VEYSPAVTERFDRPLNLGSPDGEPARRISGEAGSVEQGTWVVFEARVEANQLAKLCFRAYGCPHTIAACSRVAEKLSGAALGELVNFAPGELIEELDIPVEKAGKILILQDALRDCFEDWDTGSADRT
jgi:NifU-like protein involved in Fe-S cluster formation